MVVECATHAGKPRTPVRVILVEDADLGDTEILRQTGDDLRGFLEVGGPHVDNVGLLPYFSKELGAGKRCDIGHGGIARDRLRGPRSRRAHCADQRVDIVLLDQFAGVRHRRFGLVHVIKGDKG